MRYIILILNRVYWFLTLVKNPSPFLGAVILVTLLIGVSIRNLLLVFYSFKSEPMITNIGIDFLILVVVFIFMYWFSMKNKELIKAARVNYSKFQNWFVCFLFLFTIVSFILLANLNRKKIFDQIDSSYSNDPQIESLEGEIRNWFR